MIRVIQIFIILVLITACGTKNQIIMDKKADQLILLGKCDRAAFNNEEFEHWFYDEYDHYNVDEASLDEIRGELYKFDIEIFLGTWCGDSRREVPRFIKILDNLAYPEKQIGIFGLNKDKECPDVNADELVIEFVPTIIISIEGNEVGRIIEYPEDSLEKDLVNILRGNF